MTAQVIDFTLYRTKRKLLAALATSRQRRKASVRFDTRSFQPRSIDDLWPPLPPDIRR